MEKKKQKWKGDRRAMLLHEIMRHYGGEPKLLKHLCRESKGKICLRRQNWQNWRDRSGVPIEQCQQIAAILKISPLALSFRNYPTVVTDQSAWVRAVRSCHFLNPSIAKKLAEMKR